MQPVIVTTACADEAEAKRIGTIVLKARLAACVQIAPVTSLYWWKEAIESDQECIVTLKTKRTLVKRLAELIKKNHSYEVPEIIATDIVVAEASYQEWMEAELEK